ncbi:hypothetical protein [Streptomyces sp. NPDC001985]|uniref:hypothetical protein n=1 Tax=Streptomyces sp. NPDC001985 TaxID=3154406 RepID=UPI003325EE72
MNSRPRHGYWCECHAQYLAAPEEPPALMGAFDAYTAAQATNWITVSLHTIAPALDPHASRAASAWLQEGHIDTLQALLRGEPCTIALTQATTHITWTIRPVLYLPLAHSRQDNFHPHTPN